MDSIQDACCFFGILGIPSQRPCYEIMRGIDVQVGGDEINILLFAAPITRDQALDHAVLVAPVLPPRLPLRAAVIAEAVLGTGRWNDQQDANPGGPIEIMYHADQ